MKRNIIFSIGIVMLVCLCSCTKGKFCKCTSQDEIPDVRIVNVEWGTSCKNITEMGEEHQVVPEGDSIGTLERDMRDFVCEHIKADEVDY